MCSSSPKAPPPPPKQPEAPRLPETGATEGGDPDERRRRAASGQGATSTILTGPRGVQNGAATTTKTLLGQ